jgi:hypothetical protein
LQAFYGDRNRLAIHAGHFIIGNHHVHRVQGGDAKRFLTARSGENSEAQAFEHCAIQL